jgi:4-hydroxy-3-polyprenylbenzoate decarboxylase
VSRPRAQRLVVAITGASGAPYARRLLEVLRAMRASGEGPEVAVVLSPTAPEVWALECGGDLRTAVEPFPVWGGRDYKAPFASGSAGWDAMVVVPCSMSTVARVAQGTSDSLLTRAADVMIKEKRNLLLVPRETPLSAIHLKNLLELAQLGVTVLPAMPSFYGQPTSVDALLDTVVARILDHLGLPNDLTRRWGTPTNSA